MKKDLLIISALKMELPKIEGAVCTGFGKERTKASLVAIFEHHRPSMVISVGVVGAVDPVLKVGDVFVPEAIVDHGNMDRIYNIGFPIDQKRGLLATVPKVFEREHKYELKKMFPRVSAVDMESSAVAEFLEPLGVPLVCIKTICDEVDFDFSDKVVLKKNIDIAVKKNHDYLSNILRNIA